MNEEFRTHLDQLWVDATAHRFKLAEKEEHLAFTRLVEALVPVASSLQISIVLRDPQLMKVTRALGSVLLSICPEVGDPGDIWAAHIRGYERRLSGDIPSNYASTVYELFEKVGELAKAQRTRNCVLEASAGVSAFVHVGYMSFMIWEGSSDD